MSINPQDPISTAYHEAGHAVASFFMRRRFRNISILPKGNSLGRVVGYGSRIEPDTNHDARTIRYVERETLILYAGYYAEKKFTGKRNSPGARSDFEKATNLLSYIESGRALNALIRLQCIRARGLWTKDDGRDTFRWPVVKALAAELVRLKKMKGTDVWRFILQEGPKAERLLTPRV